MPLFESLIGPVASLLDKIIPDQEAREEAKLALLRMENVRELEAIQLRVAAIIAEAQSADPWTSRARPAFLYVMYALFLWAIPMGIIAAIRPATAAAIADGMTGYLAALPEPLYALFGTGYLGYTAARQWGKSRGIDT